MIFFDTETCGLHGVPIIIQYAENDGPVEIYNFWRNPIKDSLMLIEWLCLKEICAFNLVFDWFHICKIYNLLRIYKDRDEYPENIINELALLEATARDGLCLKPKSALDLMLHARKGPYQATMDRKDIRIKRVPTAIAYELAAELERRVPLKDIYFGRRVDKTVKKWQVEEVDDEPDFKNIVLRFAPTSALKALAIDALNLAEDDVLKYADIEIDRSLWPNEVGYAPFATALGTPRDWKHTWPEVIHYHIEHWEFNTLAREYAVKDVVYLQRLYDYFGHPAFGDDDSILACTIASIRWKGYQIALPKIKALRNKALEQAQKAPQAPNYVKRYIEQDLSEIERIAFNDTKKITLEEVAKWEDHPAAIKARAVLDARMAQKEIELYDKLIQAGRFHASFKIIGALSGRMSGADQLNPQAIKNTKEVRACFPLAPEGLILCGGDFESFEVCIGVAYYNDPDLYAELSKEEPCLDCKGAGCRECKGTGKSKKKIHALFGEELYPEETYESILASKGTENDMYKKAKSALFAMGMYSGTGRTVKDRLGIDEHIGDQAKANWEKRFPGIGRRQREIHNQFCVPSDTWTLTTHGLRQVRELINQPCKLVVNGKSYQCEGFYFTKEAEVFKIETKEGFTFKGTEDHLLFANYFSNLKRGVVGVNYWQPIKNLKIGDKIQLNNHRNIEWDGLGTFEEGYILGLLFGDGNVCETNRNKSRLMVYQPDFCLIDFIISCFKKHPDIHFNDQLIRFDIQSSELVELIAFWGVTKKKEINSNLISASSSFLKGFISGYFDADGTTRTDNREISLTQSNLKQLKYIQQILLMFGIKSTIYKKQNTTTKWINGILANMKTSYALYIGKENSEIFFERIGFQHPVKRTQQSNAIQQCKGKCIKEQYLTEIQSITPLGIQKVYDVTVKNVHCFDANGFLAHNCSMRQPNGIGTLVEWHRPSDYVESMLGFRRYFTLENSICKALFDLGQQPPKHWLQYKFKVMRRDRDQTASGAARSACFAAAFAIQGANLRAANNHVIQSTGAEITKHVQRKIADLQPIGIHPWVVMPMNIHDEIMVPVIPKKVTELKETVILAVNEYKPTVPLISIDWREHLETWADKS